ncbi:hypothetical protein FHG87_018933 [Trinorchestia longiramus]|nr:hypothetical protein FHG87_018933 [Trinorchestia longiramus]
MATEVIEERRYHYFDCGRIVTSARYGAFESLQFIQETCSPKNNNSCNSSNNSNSSKGSNNSNNSSKGSNNSNCSTRIPEHSSK